jgi:predicted kinase
MKEIIIYKGLPGCGKTTFALETLDLYPGKYKRINKDDLRAMLDCSRWSKENENFVLQLRDHIVIQALHEGKSVIIDDTNFHPKHAIRMKEIANELGQNVQVQIKDFTDVPIEECIKRDLARPNSVGEKVIRQMHEQYLKPKVIQRTHNPNLPTVILCDLDGTLCLFGDKNPYQRDFENDIPNYAVVRLLKKLDEDEYADYSIIFFSGRSDKYKNTSLDWIEKHVGIIRSQIHLYMREEGDFRKDLVIKKEMFMKYIDQQYNVLFALDDRSQVVDMWRNELGLTVFQVAEGNF